MDSRAVELFAGVGGFRLGLEGAGHRVAWSNQWEPGRKSQHASDCYVRHFGADGHVNDDIAQVKPATIPDHDLLVGGFPCQDYSVATTKATGIQGKKGVLWWEIHRLLRHHRTPYVLLENVDRLLKSPTTQRGRDMGVMLWCLQSLGYAVEWRVVNAADYGAPQRRRRVFIFAAQPGTAWGDAMMEAASPWSWLGRAGLMAKAFPVVDERLPIDGATAPTSRLPAKLQDASDSFGAQFASSGLLLGRNIWTRTQAPRQRAATPLGSVLLPDAPAEYALPSAQISKWRYLKGAKAEPRKAKNGFEYHYTEGALPFPDPLDRPSRTILTSEGGAGPSRFKHIVEDPGTGRLRRLTPVEVERLNQFPDDWTKGMPEGWRYFCMGNALVVGLIERLGCTLARGPSARALPSKAPATAP